MGDELADPPEADHAERLAVQLVAGEPRPRPIAPDQRGVRLGDVPAQGERQGERVLGGRDRVRLGGVDDHDAALGGRVDVDVVDAGAGAADHLQPRAALDQVRGQRGLRADHDPVELADSLAQLLVGHLEAELDLEVAAQELDAGLGDLLLDQDLRLAVGHQPTGRPRRAASAGRREHALGRRGARAGLGVVAEVAQRHLERGQGDHDVEGPVVAAVGDARDPALQVALPAGDRDPVAVAHQLRHLGAVDLLGKPRHGDHVRVLVVGAEPLQPQRLDPGPRGAGEQRVAGEGLDRGPPRTAARAPRRGRETGSRPGVNAELGGSSCLAGGRAPPSRGSSGAPGFSAASAIARSETEANASPGGHISDFCEPATTTSTPHSSCGRSTAPRPETASTQSTEPCAVATSLSARMSLTTPVEVSDWVVNTARAGRPRPASASSSRRRVHLLAPLELQVHGVGAVGVAELRPALAELAARGDDGGLAGDRPGWRPPTPSRRFPWPRSRGPRCASGRPGAAARAPARRSRRTPGRGDRGSAPPSPARRAAAAASAPRSACTAWRRCRAPRPFAQDTEGRGGQPPGASSPTAA